MASGTKLSDTLSYAGPLVFYDFNFRNTLEYHVPNLLNHSETMVTSIPNGTAHQFTNDFFGLLTTFHVAPQYWWITMRCNGYYNPLDYQEDRLILIQPPIRVIDDIARIWTTNNNMSFG